MNIRLVNIVLFFCLYQTVFCQIHVAYERNIDLWKPYTEYAQEYSKKNDQINSNTQSLSIGYNLQKTSLNDVVLEFSYKTINHRVLDVIRSIQVIEYSLGTGEHLDTSYIKGSADLITKSHNLGFNFGYGKTLFQVKKQTGKIYCNIGLYLFEISKSQYVYDAEFINNLPGTFNHYYYQPDYSRMNYRYGFFLSSINLSTYYKHVWQLHENFSLAGRLSLGTNLYSEWDQFKKYVWLGAGLELGFGKPRSIGAKIDSEK